MKRLANLLTVLLFVTAVCPALALADQEITIKDSGVSLTIPEGFFCFTRELGEEDPVWEQTGVDREAMLESLAAQNIALDAVAEDLSYEIALIVSDSESIEKFFDYNLYENDSLLRLFTDDTEELLAENGMAYSDVSIHQSPEAKFVAYTMRADQLEEPRRSFTTIYNGRAFTFVAGSYTGDPPESYDAALTELADSLHFLEKLSPRVTTFAEEERESPLEAALHPGDILSDAFIGAAVGGTVWLVSSIARHKRGLRIGDPETKAKE